MYKMIILLFCTSMLVAMDEPTAELTPERKSALLAIMKRENPTVSPTDKPWDRVKRNTCVLVRHPIEFYTDTDRAELLVKYVTDRDLYVEGDSLTTALGRPHAMEMREEFEADQRQQIQEYRRRNHLLAHPNIQQLYYLMNVFGLARFAHPESSWTVALCIGCNTFLGCCST